MCGAVRERVVVRWGDVCRAACSAPARGVGDGLCLFISAMDNSLLVDDALPARGGERDLPLPTDQDLYVAAGALRFARLFPGRLGLRRATDVTAEVARLGLVCAQMRDVVEAAVDWVESEGDCHFCMLCIGWDGDPRHDEDCPLGGLDWPAVREQVAQALGR